MTEQIEAVIRLYTNGIDTIKFHRDGIVTYEIATPKIINIIDDLLVWSEKVLEILKIAPPSEPYLNHFSNDFSKILQYFRVPRKNTSKLHFISFCNNFEADIPNILYYNHNANFNLDFFKKIGFLKNNVVAVGANGSGKTSLSQKLRSITNTSGILISAQRILLIPKFEDFKNPSKTAEALKQHQLRDNTNKNSEDFPYLQNEFKVVIQNLLSKNISASHFFRKKAIAQIQHGYEISCPVKTGLDITMEIWNSLIDHRRIQCEDGMNITVTELNENSYDLLKASDGEKVLLYLIAQVLQAPESGFIVVDEPEMYLHKTILQKLWDILEKEREDCIFIYLTHDLDFASSRISAKKIWIRSYAHPDRWDIEPIPENELPESLMMELLGSRKNILFCEGERGSIDEKIYSVLYPEYTVIPISTSTSVIDYTKAFNKLPNSTIKACGIIDSDHHPIEKLQALKYKNVHSISLAEVENLFLDEAFLKLLATQLMVDPAKIELIKTDILSQLEMEMELQISNYVSSKINYYFKKSHVSKGNSFNDVTTNYANFTKDIKIEEWFGERKNELGAIIEKREYDKALSVFNNKGLRKIVHTHFNISDFTDRAVKLLQFNTDTHEILLKHLPIELKTSNAIIKA